jgi:predicted membrane channel-forming protein YqfA (hemolysin III family)
MTRAEALGLALVSVLATGVILPYLADPLGSGVAPRATVVAVIAVAAALVAWIRPASSGSADTAVFVSVVGASLFVFCLARLALPAAARRRPVAVKMFYLAIYPTIAAAMIAIGRASPTPLWTVIVVVVMLAAAGRHLTAMPTPTPTASRDLWVAGSWSREHLPPSWVDYLVGNEYTA